MALEIKPDEVIDLDDVDKQEAKRKRELVRRFADQFASMPVEITPKWRRAIDNYKRLKSECIYHE